MNPDNFQQAWQADKAQIHVKFDADDLQKEVQSSQRNFLIMIFWRDFREIVVGLMMLPGWIFWGIASSQPWTWYLTVPALLCVIMFILIDRMRHPQTLCDPGEPLFHSVQIALIQLEHQIWLLRNVFWWYLLPPSISITAYFVQTSWQIAGCWWGALMIVPFPSVFLLVLYRGVYLLNQYAIRKQLEPRRQELLALLASLSEEETSEIDQLQTLGHQEIEPAKSNRGLLKNVLHSVFQYTDRIIRSVMYGGVYFLKKTALRKLPEPRRQEFFAPFIIFIEELTGVDATSGFYDV